MKSKLLFAFTTLLILTNLTRNIYAQTESSAIKTITQENMYVTGLSRTNS